MKKILMLITLLAVFVLGLSSLSYAMGEKPSKPGKGEGKGGKPNAVNEAGRGNCDDGDPSDDPFTLGVVTYTSTFGGGFSRDECYYPEPLVPHYGESLLRQVKCGEFKGEIYPEYSQPTPCPSGYGCNGGICSRCGNLVVDADEQCDFSGIYAGFVDQRTGLRGPPQFRSNTNGAQCSTFGFGEQWPLKCDNNCRFDTSECRGSPGNPYGATPPNAGVPQSGCGNWIIEQGELCDGGNVNHQTCADFGYVYGSLGCSSSCDTYSTAHCRGNAANPYASAPPASDPNYQPQCGNTFLDSGEECDLPHFRPGLTCPSGNYYRYCDNRNPQSTCTCHCIPRSQQPPYGTPPPPTIQCSN